VIFDLAREINTQRASGASVEDLDARRRTLVHLLDVLGLDIRSEAPSDQRGIDPFVDLLLDVRRKLRGIKQWELADEIRTRLAEHGVTVEDRPGGDSTWRL
jgi:cysteinyl-tRNA synthetase